jgi:hypothetical protein
MSCVACELDRKAKGGADVPGGADNMLSMVCATDSAEPWAVACQHCNAVKADTIPWIIADNESVSLAASMEHEKEDVMPHTVIQCEQCKTSQFPMFHSRLTRRHPSDPNRKFFHPDHPEEGIPMESFPFKHYVKGCTGALITIPILISKLEGKFCGQALPQSPYLPLDSSFVPGFIPPLEWLTGAAHKEITAQRERRKDKFVLASTPLVEHRNPVWRDRAFVGIFGDVFVRDTELEGGHIAESVDAMHFILDALYRSSNPNGNVVPSPTFDDRKGSESGSNANENELLPFNFCTHSWLSTYNDSDGIARNALRSVIRTLWFSISTIHHAKDVLDALSDKNLTEEEKQRFHFVLIRQWRRRVKKLKPGETIILPGGWIGAKAGHAIMHILIYNSDGATFSFVTCNTGGGLTYHPSTVSDNGSKMLFQTSIRIDGIRREAIMDDDAFWLLFWRLQAIQSDDHDHHTLYEILLPTLADKPLAEAIIPVGKDPFAEWRTPQRAGNCYLKVSSYLLLRNSAMHRSDT